MAQLGGAVCSKVSEVSNEVEMMKKLNEELYQAIDALQSRLQPVLRNIPPSPCAESEKTAICLVPLANSLREENKKISYAIIITNQIRERIEI